SGGVTTAHEAATYLDAGARRVVLGSGALADREALLRTLEDFGDALLVGLEVEGGVVRARGTGALELPLDPTLAWIGDLPAAGFLVTAVAQVATLSGPDSALIARVAALGRPTIGAGGIGSIDDLETLRRAGASGAVVGRAALDGDLDVRAAIAWAGT